MKPVLYLIFTTLAFPVIVTNGLNSCLNTSSSDYRDCSAGSYSTTSYPGELYLDDCGFVDADIPDIIECFDNFGRDSLSSIHLGDNDFRDLPEYLFDGYWPKMEGLWIDNTNISTLPAGLLSNLTNLEYLNLEDNLLEYLPEGVFDGLTELESLHLCGNVIEGFPTGVFSDLESMELLDLEDNKLSKLKANVFDNFGSQIRFIILSENELSGLPPGLFSNCEDLTYLYLDNNNLTTLPAGIFLNLTSLLTLDLSGNENLECVPTNSASTLLLPDNYDDDYSTC